MIIFDESDFNDTLVFILSLLQVRYFYSCSPVDSFDITKKTFLWRAWCFQDFSANEMTFGKREKIWKYMLIREWPNGETAPSNIDVSVVGIMKLVIADFLVTYLFHREVE